MKYIFTILLAFFTVTSAKTQNLRPSVQYLVDSIGRMECIPVRYYSFIDTFAFELDRIATTEELLKLTDHSQPIVRARALLFLLARAQRSTLPEVNFSALFIQHLFDTATVCIKVYEEYRPYDRILPLCSLYAQKVGGYFGQTGMYLPGKSPSFCDKDKHLMDSLILCQQVPLIEEKETLVFSLDTITSFYPKIKEQLLQFNDENAVIYLAKYQKEADINLILAHLPTGKSVHGVQKHWFPFRFFQHPQLFLFLKEQLDTYWKDSRFMGCIAQYQSKEAANLLSEIYNREKKEKKAHYLKSNLRRVIEQYYSAPYADLYVTILSENAPFGYLRLPDELWEHQGDTLFLLYEKWKESDNKWAKRDVQSLYPKAKEYIEKNHPEKVAEVVFKQIEMGENYRKYARSFFYIKQSKDTVFVDPLFSLLKEEPKPDNRFFIIKIIMSFKNQAVNHRLESFFLKHPALIPTIADAEAGALLYKDLEYYAKQKNY